MNHDHAYAHGTDANGRGYVVCRCGSVIHEWEPGYPRPLATDARWMPEWRRRALAARDRHGFVASKDTTGGVTL